MGRPLRENEYTLETKWVDSISRGVESDCFCQKKQKSVTISIRTSIFVE